MPNITERDNLTEEGVNLLAYIHNKAWFASIPSDKSLEIANHPYVRSIVWVLPDDKISPKVRMEGVGDYSTNGDVSDSDATVNLTIRFYDDVSLYKGINIISKYNGNVTGNTTLTNNLVVVVGNSSIIDLAENESIQWISEIPPPGEDENDGSRAAVSANTVQIIPYNLTGSGVRIGQVETGHPWHIHSDFRGRIFKRKFVDDEPTTHHATHVAGIILGNGTRSIDEGADFPYQWRGIATNATIYSYRRWDNNERGEPWDELGFDRIYRNAIIDKGIHLSTNSWGWWDNFNGYEDEEEALDGVVRGGFGVPISIVYSAGKDRWGEILYGTINDPKTAKNIIVVGATNSNDDSMIDNSNWGPTDDGRIKPDVVAPGAENDENFNQYNPEPDESIWSCKNIGGGAGYTGDHGTSMAAPVVSGSLALMLEYWRGIHGEDPLPSTLKAILMQTTKDLGNTGPDYMFGYGRINVTEAIHLIEVDSLNNNTIIESKFMDQNEEHNYSFYVPKNQKELQITLVWDDYPGTNNDFIALTNDIDLVVIAPDGTHFFPWTLDPDNPANGAVRNQRDDRNNVEQVYVNISDYNDNPLTGTWNISIRTIFMGMVRDVSQNYSLVSNIPPLPVFSVKNDGSNIAWFGSLGNIVLNGTCIFGEVCNAPPDSLVFKHEGETVAYIDPSGNLCIEADDCFHSSPHCNDLVGDSFIIKNESKHNVIYIDSLGDLCLTGVLSENSTHNLLTIGEGG